MSDESAASPGPTPFERLGGETGVRALVDRFYDLMDLEPAYAGIRALHPTALDGSRDKLFWFLCGWLGGPNHYIERFGHQHRIRAAAFITVAPHIFQIARQLDLIRAILGKSVLGKGRIKGRQPVDIDL